MAESPFRNVENGRAAVQQKPPYGKTEFHIVAKIA
jgi:hypothetical protein